MFMKVVYACASLVLYDCVHIVYACLSVVLCYCVWVVVVYACGCDSV